MEDQELRHIIQTQEEAITNLNLEIRQREEIMREAIAEADALHKTLSSTFLRMLAARIERK